MFKQKKNRNSTYDILVLFKVPIGLGAAISGLIESFRSNLSLDLLTILGISSVMIESCQKELCELAVNNTFGLNETYRD